MKNNTHPNYFIRLTKGQEINNEGLYLLRLAIWQGDPKNLHGPGTKEIEHTVAVSGAPGHQNFRLGKDSIPGSLEPIPQGDYFLGVPDWAGGFGNYQAEWEPGLGPVVVPISNTVAGQTLRDLLRIHADWNEERSPGTAGCIGLQIIINGVRDLIRLKTVMSWMYQYHPSRLFVFWGL